MLFVVLIPFSVFATWLALYVAVYLCVLPFILLGRALGLLLRPQAHANSAREPVERLEPRLAPLHLYARWSEPRRGRSRYYALHDPVPLLGHDKGPALLPSPPSQRRLGYDPRL